MYNEGHILVDFCLFSLVNLVYYGASAKNSEGQPDNYFPPPQNLLLSSARLHWLLVVQQTLGLEESPVGNPQRHPLGKRHHVGHKSTGL